MGPKGKLTRFDGGKRPWNIPRPKNKKADPTEGENRKLKLTAHDGPERIRICLSCTAPAEFCEGWNGCPEARKRRPQC